MLADIHINKVDSNGTVIADAVLVLKGTDENGKPIIFNKNDVVFGDGTDFIGDGEELKWVTGNDSTFIKNLPDGEYVLQEIFTPDGYEPSKDIHFAISDGEVVNNIDNTVIMTAAKLGEVEISKQNVYGEEIIGAELTLTGKDADGNDIVFALENVMPGQNAELITSEDSTELTWLSGSTPTYVKNLPDGTYVLHEVAAPSGYEVTTDMTFTVENGELSGEIGVDSTSVTMMDDMIKTDVTISKENIFSQEIPGATLTLTGVDFTGRPVSFDGADVTLGTGAEFVSDGRHLTWISGTSGTNIKNLPDGTYVLHEDAAPSGYLVSTDIEFTIENGEVKGEIGVESNSVTMVDDMIVTTTTTTTTTSDTTTTTTSDTTTTTDTTTSDTTTTDTTTTSDTTTTTDTTTTSDTTTTTATSDTTTTDSTDTSTTTAATTTKKTTTKKITTTKKTTAKKDDAPKTGDAGIAIPAAALALAAATAFVLRKKREDEE